MKLIKYIFLLFALLTLNGCNSEDLSYNIDYTPIHPLGGQYVVTISKDGKALQQIYCTISNTTNNDTDKCWIRIGSYATAGAIGINGKINCNVENLTFSGSDIENLAGNVASSTETFTITDGKLVLNGATAPSGTTADKLTFTYTTTKDPGVTYSVEGYRYTGWPEDDY